MDLSPFPKERLSDNLNVEDGINWKYIYVKLLAVMARKKEDCIWMFATHILTLLFIENAPKQLIHHCEICTLCKLVTGRRKLRQALGNYGREHIFSELLSVVQVRKVNTKKKITQFNATDKWRWMPVENILLLF